MNYRIFILFFLCLGVSLIQAENYLVTVYGRLVDGAGKGVANKTIYINQAPGSNFAVSEKATTFESGEFKWPVYLHDSIRHGVLILSFVNCDGKEVISRYEFSKAKPLIEAKLVFCDRPGKDCVSSVVVTRINDSMAHAVVIAKGTAPFTHKWTTGQDGDSIIYNPQNKIRICVVTKDSAGCVSEACIPTTNAPCAVHIEQRDKYLYAIVKEGQVKSYHWNTGADGNKVEIKESGEYCVKILTTTGCEAKACIVVHPISCQAEIVAHRTGDNGSVQAYKLYVKASFDLKFIQWSTGEKNHEIIVKKSGEYCVSISDEKNCKSFLCKKVELPDADSCRVTILAERIPLTNTADVLQKVKLTAKPYFRPVLYYWSTRDTTPSIIVQSPGEYCVTVSDGVHCKTYACIKVELPDGNSGKCESTIIVHQRVTGELQLIPRVAGKAPFTFLWSTGSKDAQITVKTSGKYCVTVKDAGGCSTLACTEVSFEKPGGGLKAPESDKANTGALQLNQKNNIQLTIHPNPTSDQLIYQINSRLNEPGNLSITNLYGRAVYQEKIAVQDGLSAGQLDLSFLPPGVYMIHINQDGFHSTKKLIIER
ncbi:MAG: T9SS type A sorting domain-containing protein [Saprospiraceae bacterium]|nr:T9SS type A sorting domain-containing protein [Saprospiraceae bacterium]